MKRTNRGFTLVELLVALAMLALTSALGFESLRFGLRAWSGVTGDALRSEEIWTAQRFLRGRLEQMYPTSGGEYSFCAPLPAHENGGMPHLFRILHPDDSLRVAWRPGCEETTAASTGEWDEETLLSGVEKVEWRYLDVTPEGNIRWTETWSDLRRIPRLIRVKVWFVEPTRVWPVLYVAPRVTARRECEFDFVSRKCRQP